LDEEVPITHRIENILDFHLPLLKDAILETKVQTTRKKMYTSFLVGRKEQKPTNAKWMTTEMLQRNLPHMWSEAEDSSKL